MANANSEKYDLSKLYWRPMIVDENYNYVTDLPTVRPITHLWQVNGQYKGFTFPQFIMLEYTANESGFDKATSTIIVSEGDGFSVELGNYYDNIRYFDENGNLLGEAQHIKFEPLIRVELYNINGGITSIYPTNVNTYISNNRINFSFDVESVPFDVYRFRIVLYELSNPFDLSGIPQNFARWDRVFLFDEYSTHSVKNIPEEKGLLKSIISWLIDIKDKIVDLPDKIWSAIENGLKELFVPDESYISSYSNKWDELLSMRFGAIYEVGSYLIELGNSIINSLNDNNNENFSIDFPLVKIPIGNDLYFDFGGWNVPVKIKEFSALYLAIKFIVAIVGTLLFLNGIRKRYDEVMGVDS